MRMLIDGKLVEASSGRTFENVNPATEEILGVTADAGTEDMDAAIAAARRAFDATDWSTDHTFRRHCLGQLATAIEEADEEIRQVTIAEGGVPMMVTFMSKPDLSFLLDLMDSYEYERFLPETSVFGSPVRRIVRREAVGVAALITPWNGPHYINLSKLAPALAAGCTTVLKPAPDTPWTATVLGRVIAERTDLPPGVVNIVPTTSNEVAAMLSTDPRIDLVAFTGSTATGRQIMASGAATMKRMLLELGGKSAAIVLDDANFEDVVPVAAASVCVLAGQGCVHTTRILLPRSRYEEGVALAAEAFGNVCYGDPTEFNNIQGPQINARHRERILGYIETAKAEGARLLHGGGIPAEPAQGFFVEPTLFADVDPDSTIAQEEIFGPVQALIPFENDDDAVRIANNSIYGLSGAVFSASEERALNVARRIRTGTLAVNGGFWLAPDTPFGGFRQSGLGREGGVEGFEEFLEIKTIGLPG